MDSIQKLNHFFKQYVWHGYLFKFRITRRFKYWSEIFTTINVIGVIGCIYIYV